MGRRRKSKEVRLLGVILANPEDAKHFEVGTPCVWPPPDPNAPVRDSGPALVVEAVDHATGTIKFRSG